MSALALLLAAVALLTLLTGVVLAFVAAQRDRTRMQGELQQAQRGLERANRELERRNAELLRELRQVERMKQEFLATVSHELRTPLTAMLGALGLVRSPHLELGADQEQELLEITERNGARLLRLINDLLDLQRLEAGELPFDPAAEDSYCLPIGDRDMGIPYERQSGRMARHPGPDGAQDP